ncbi:biogenesis of lysosome-related organelles complex 1 subunit 5 isoform X2 [Anoplophora glabripennis]|nr:biogenesis of lysosome-related organelles complex 1 subunit 5 isoform X2 [Anoplophora glabripennis]
MVREFEQKRGDREVDNLFRVIENITEIKDTEIERCKQVGDQALNKANIDLAQALDICSCFGGLEETYKQDATIEDTRHKRKIVWDAFMDGVTAKYSEINSSFEVKEEELRKLYDDFEKKLLV